MHRYKAWNSAMVTTATLSPVTTGTAVKTMLQLATPSTRQIQLISWGYSLDSPPTTSSSTIELLQANVAATVTAHVASGVQPLDPGSPASLLSLGTSATGFTATAEGTITSSRSLDSIHISGGTSTAVKDISYVYQWMPDERPIINNSSFVRVRVDMSTAVNMSCWIVWEE